MATGITGRLIRRTTKEPLQGITIEAVNASTGVSASTTTTTDTKGFFELNGLTSAVYFAKPLVSGDDWDLLPNIAEIYTDEIHIAAGGSLTIDGAITTGEVSSIDVNLTSTSSSNTRGLDVNLSSSSGTGDRTAVYGSVLKSGTASMLSLLGGDFSAESTSTGGTITAMAAVGGIAAANGAGQTITSLVGASGAVIGTAGTVTEGIGVAASASYGTTQIGVKITNPSSGANNYAIYSSATAKSYFAGAMDVVGALTHNGTAVSDSGHGNTDHANRTRYLHLVPIGWDVTIGTSPRYMTFADGATTNILFGAVLPEDYVGSSCTLKFLYGSSATGNNLRIATNVYQDQDGQAEGNIDSNTRTVAVSGSANVMTLFSEAIGSNPTAGSYIKVHIQRIGADAADTNTGTARITTPWIEYTADM